MLQICQPQLLSLHGAAHVHRSVMLPFRHRHLSPLPHRRRNAAVGNLSGRSRRLEMPLACLGFALKPSAHSGAAPPLRTRLVRQSRATPPLQTRLLHALKSAALAHLAANLAAPPPRLSVLQRGFPKLLLPHLLHLLPLLQ